MRQNLGYHGAGFLLQYSYYSLFIIYSNLRIIYSNNTRIGVNYLLSLCYSPLICLILQNISINIRISSAFYLLFCKMRQNSGYQGAGFLLQYSYYSLFIIYSNLHIIYSNNTRIGVNYLLFLCYSPLLCLIFAKIYL
jgi:hypothetical protein